MISRKNMGSAHKSVKIDGTTLQISCNIKAGILNYFFQSAK